MTGKSSTDSDIAAAASALQRQRFEKREQFADVSKAEGRLTAAQFIVQRFLLGAGGDNHHHSTQ